MGCFLWALLKWCRSTFEPDQGFKVILVVLFLFLSLIFVVVEVVAIFPCGTVIDVDCLHCAIDVWLWLSDWCIDSNVSIFTIPPYTSFGSQGMRVFTITTIFSILAYLWLIVVLIFNTKDEVGLFCVILQKKNKLHLVVLSGFHWFPSTGLVFYWVLLGITRFPDIHLSFNAYVYTDRLRGFSESPVKKRPKDWTHLK